MLLIAGLGNPGPKYAGNRHNIGFMAADQTVRRHNFSPWQKKFSGLVCEGMLDGEKAIVLKPQTFMNNSGQAVGEALRFYKLELKDLVVIYDELDLFPGKLRVKTGGGSGGHNGIRSIDQHCGKDYRRVRVGIGHPGAKELVLHYVLGDFAKVEHQWLDPMLDAIAGAAPLLAKADDAGFMNKVAVSLGQGDQRKAEPPKAASHISQARPHAAPKMPETGPMAAMLRRLFGKE
jgi:peptidyl-tRNA hydrolase, PTH1 family